MPNIGTLKLNVEVLDTCDCYNLAVIDLSYYITSVEKPKLTITPPGYNPIVFDFTINQTNIFNSYSLGLTDVNTVDQLLVLPDGVYEITYSVCPHDSLYATIYHLRTCNLDKRLSAFWAKQVTICDTDSKIYKNLDIIEILLRGAKANAQICNTDKAVELYKKADELLRRLETTINNCNC